MNYLSELNAKLLRESNVTSNLDGGQGPIKTPYAFKDIDYEEENEFIKNIKLKTKSVTVDLEESYHNYVISRKSSKTTEKQLINNTIALLNKNLSILEQLVDHSQNLKKTTLVTQKFFWKRTLENFVAIYEKLIRLQHKLKNLSQ